MPMLCDDFDTDLSVSMTWSVDETGTLRHKPTGMKVSPDTGIEVDGHEYRLSPQEIELDRDATLGTGASGVVQAGVHKPTGMRVAVKTVKVDNREKREQMLAEIRGLIQAEGCPYLVQWYAGFAARENGFVHVVVELMDRGSLVDLRRRLDGKGVAEEPLACIAAQIVKGLQHLQTRKLLHRDVKPANILINRAGQAKLTDFGISKDLNSTVGVAATFVGTATYMAPERVLGKDYSFQADTWSAGVVFYELATGPHLFSMNFVDLFECLCNKPEPRLDASRFSPALCDFVEHCLIRDETRRKDALGLSDHEFIADQGDQQVAELGAWFTTLFPD
jgi:serine/threonine protein kinase